MWESLKNKLGLKPSREVLEAQLLEAAGNNNRSVIIQAIRDGASFQSATTMGYNALDLAASRGHVDAIHTLLELGFDIDTRNKRQRTALHTAAFRNQFHAVKALLEAGAEVDPQSELQESPLHRAAVHYNGDITVVKLLLAAGADLALTDQSGRTPIDEARSYDTTLADYLRSIAEGRTHRPTPEEAGLELDKRIAALNKLGKPLGQFTEAEQKRKRQRETREAQRQAALGGEGI